MRARGMHRPASSPVVSNPAASTPATFPPSNLPDHLLSRQSPHFQTPPTAACRIILRAALTDITFYGNSLFQPAVLHLVFNATDSGVPQPIAGGLGSNVCLQMALVAAIGLPGYYVAVALMDRLGRRNIQLQGFLFMALAFGALGLWLEELQRVPMLMLAIYAPTFFFSNFGPNSTTFILPSETFPTHLRTTLNGFSAASGKLGATIGSAVFKPLESAIGLSYTMLACAGVSLVGFVITAIYVEDRRKPPRANQQLCCLLSALPPPCLLLTCLCASTPALTPHQVVRACHA